MLSTLAFAGFIVSTMGHGRLTKPKTRVGHTGYENDPIGFAGRPARQYICRHDSPNPQVTPETVNAGGKLTVQWVTTAAHVGDCALYMSYDGDKALEDMRWFKIANKQNCKSFTGQDVQFDLPSWLPGGNAVLRWEWYALHVYPTIEFYAQCADIVVKPTAQEIPLGDLPTFKVYENGQKTSLPLNGKDGVGFRNAFSSEDQNWSPSNPSQFMTGPSCVDDSINNCALTAAGTTGHVALALSNGETPVVTPTEDPATSAPVIPSQEPSTEAPVIPSEEPSTQSPVSPTEDPATLPPVIPTQPPSNGDCTPVVAAYEQCDGEGFALSNPNGCPICPAGYQCYKKSKWLSNCNHSCPEGLGWDCESDEMDAPEYTPAPTDAPEPEYTPAPTEALAPTPTDDDSDCPNGLHATCGGSSNPNAPHCCQAGLTCKVFSEWHSQCEN